MEASRLDPNSAMSYWGQAFALGPNINDPQPDDERKKKYNEAMTNAKRLKSSSTPKEQALIEALAARYSEDLTKDVAELNMSYMKAMTKVVKKYPDRGCQYSDFICSISNEYRTLELLGS